ncbi:hypothetical protein Dvina_44655 [Dactylosporangium vinaceum]|uniref:Sensor histidine kinase n=1 Tax=Dactylosporangium vinaceum TaxID=53362 RepID=A0ABV5MND7_9ACTN|nr:ATP-binding protein [Dactylosporangium vinaceum]UAB95076.1 hypothetical protein Dvina_44655 [Dactylosporangium vinaceum]
MESPKTPPGSRTAVLLGGLSAPLLIMATAGRFYPPEINPAPTLNLYVAVSPADAGQAVYFLAPIVAIVAGLLLLRRWPLLLVVAGLLALPNLLQTVWSPPALIQALTWAAQPLAFIALLAAAQSMLRRGAAGWGTLLAALGVGAAPLGMALPGFWWPSTEGIATAQRALVLVPLAFAAAAAVLLRGRDPEAAGETGWARTRLILAGGLALTLSFPLGSISPERLGAMLDVSSATIVRNAYLVYVIAGAITLVVVTALAAMAGPWSLGGALTVATAMVAMVAPVLLALHALEPSGAALPAIAAGVAIGAALARSRRRFPLTVGMAVAAAIVLFITYAGTSGNPDRLIQLRSVVPAVLIAVAVIGAVTATAGTVASALAPTGAVPATLGPLAVVLALGGRWVVVATTYRKSEVQDLRPALSSGYYESIDHLPTSGILLLIAAAAVGGLGFAHQWATRRADRRRAEQIREEAAEAERNRLARPIHDGVLQVLSLMQRHGQEMGGAGARLATLAGEQERALRNLLSGGPPTAVSADADLRAALMAFTSPKVEVAAPAGRVLLPAAATAELTAAVQAALDNVGRHAGPDAHTWVLLEDEGDGVRVTVRDNGRGFEPDRLPEAAAAGRLGVAQSMRGRIDDLGGQTSIHSRPGRGTEVEFYVPRTGGRP